MQIVIVVVFLSTLSLRRATPHCYQQTAYFFYFYPRSPCGERPIGPLIFSVQPHFYPRSPCGERRFSCYLDNIEISISIHALLAESDAETAKTSIGDIKFLSTLSLRRATFSLAFGVFLTCIFLSTLSLRRATTIGPPFVR